MKFFRSKQKFAVRSLFAGLLALCLLWFAARSPNAEESNDTADLTGAPVIAAARGIVEVEGGLLRVTPPRDGMVASLLVREGDEVKAGHVLATLDASQEILTAKIASEEALQAEEHYKLLQMKMKNLSRQADRVRRAAAGHAVSEQALDEAVLAQDSLAGELKVAASQLAATKMRSDMAAREVEIRTIRSPVDGFVIRQSIKVGEFAVASSATEMFTILPDGRKIVRAEIPEQFLDNLKPGVPVDIRAEDRNERAYEGQISRISPVLMQSNEVPGDRNDIRTASSIILVAQDAPLRVGQRVIIRVFKE